MRILKIFIAVLPFLMASLPVLAQKDLRLKAVDFEGNEILNDDVLLGRINTQPKKGLQKIFFWKKRPDFITAVLQEDINRLRSFYNRNGFLNPAISFNLDSSHSGRLIDVKIVIDENEFVKVDSLDIILKGDPVTSELVNSLKPLIPLKPGQRFIDDDVFGTIDMMKRNFSDHGYPFITVGHDVSLRDSNLRAGVAFNIIPGTKSYFGNIKISGDSLVPERFIRKYLQFAESGLYSQEMIDSTQQDLFDTDLFQYVVIASLKDSVKDNRIPVEIMVKELPRWALETGIGYGTEDKLRLAAQLTRLNFFGGTRRLIVNAKTSYFLPFSFDVRFLQPDFILPKLDLVINPFYMREREESYRIDRAGGSVNFLYPLKKIIITNLSYAIEHDNIVEINELRLDSSELKQNKSVISTGIQLNTSDDPFYPSKGFRFNINLSYAGIGFGNTAHYYKIVLLLVNYFALAEETVLATKISTGVVQTVRLDQRTPLGDRFYLGGASSLRGWGRHKITSFTENGFPVGGNTMIEGSAELRFPIYGILHGVTFMDAGNVWAGSYEYGFDRLHYNAGVGLRVKTPIGPVRLDFATPVINDGFDFQFFISVGHVF